MKKFFILSMAAFFVFGVTSWAGAEYSSSFWVVDGNDSGTSVTLNSISSNVWYNFNGGSSWELLPGELTINTTNGVQQVFLKFGDGSTSVPLQFQGKLYPDIAGSQLYHTVLGLPATWSSFSISTAQTTTDAVSPVPIPATVWLLGAGLIGLVGVRRKFQR
jgi:hypothetical protein